MMVEKLPSSRELENAVLGVLKSNTGPLTNQQISQEVTDLLKISPELQRILHSSSRTELEYRLAWARTKVSKKNLIVRIGPKTWKAV